jgi:hypothetical protein
MPTKSGNARKSRNWEETYDLPRELDFRKLRVVGIGLESLRKHTAAVRKVVELEPDVAKEFPTAKAVNDALRQFQEIRRMVQSGKRSRKTA